MIDGVWKKFKDSMTVGRKLEREASEDTASENEEPEEKQAAQPEEEPVGAGSDVEADQDLEDEGVDESEDADFENKMECPNCGVDIDSDSKFCNECGVQIKGVKDEDYEAEEPGGIEPWALKTAEWFKKIPRGAKIGVPVAVLILIAGLVALFVIAGFHSPSANIERYLSHVKVGDYKDAYDMLSHPEGEFSSFDYFEDWQSFQVDELGRLLDYEIKDRQHENRIFGKVISEDSVEGLSFVATLNYAKTTFDVRIDVEPAGGTWPANRYKIRLSHEPTRVLVSPVGSEIMIDGTKTGTAQENETLEDALSLGDLPNDLDSAIEYVKKIINVVRDGIDEFKRIMVKVDDVADEAQWIFDQFSASGFSWGSVVDSTDRIVQQSKDVGMEVARLVMKIYWIFGGGDDGSTRADLTRTETGLDLDNLPEGLHGIEASLPGCKTAEETFFAPDGVNVTLDPTKETEQKLAKAINDYFIAYVEAVRKLNAETLKTATSGKLLESDTQKVLDLLGKDQFEDSALKTIKFDEFKMLSETVAIVTTNEKWSVSTYQGSELVSALANVERDVTYTLKLGKDGIWKVIEKKVD